MVHTTHEMRDFFRLTPKRRVFFSTKTDIILTLESIHHIKEHILQATFELILMGKAPLLSFELVAEHANLTVETISSLYEDIDAISLELTIVSLAKHREESLALSKQKGLEALSNLLTHDLKFFYDLEMDRKIVTPSQYSESFLLFDEYMSNELPNYYIQFLQHNQDIVPSGETDLFYYGHFIAHSILFFNRAHLSPFINKLEDRKHITEQIIASLFKKSQLTLSKFQIPDEQHQLS